MCSAEIPTGANRVHPEQGQVLGTEGIWKKLHHIDHTFHDILCYGS
jgi:hypothetical protein